MTRDFVLEMSIFPFYEYGQFRRVVAFFIIRVFIITMVRRSNPRLIAEVIKRNSEIILTKKSLQQNGSLRYDLPW